MDANLVRSRENNFLAAVARVGARSAVAYVDISTGEFRVTEFSILMKWPERWSN